jgi:uncharacterized lipoprotein YajG
MRFLKFLCAGAAAAVLFNLAGCATSATSQAMTVKPGTTATVNPKLKGAVKVAEVTGGKETSPLWTSQVDNAGFRKALVDSLAISGYLAADSNKAMYSVSADLVSLEQPLMGFTFDVKSDVNYKLSGPGGARAYPIKATGTATVSDAFAGVERLRIANERSVLENIQAFVNQLAKFAD